MVIAMSDSLFVHPTRSSRTRYLKRNGEIAFKCGLDVHENYISVFGDLLNNPMASPSCQNIYLNTTNSRMYLADSYEM